MMLPLIFQIIKNIIQNITNLFVIFKIQFLYERDTNIYFNEEEEGYGILILKYEIYNIR